MAQGPDVPPDVPLDGLYGDLILDHYRHPRHREPVQSPDLEAEEYNPFCGDRVILHLKFAREGRVCQVSANSEGCSIIQATASMMADALEGKGLEELEDLSRRFRDRMYGRPSSKDARDDAGDDPSDLGALDALTVVRQFPVRIKCALLPWTALEEGIKVYRSSHTRDQ